MRSCVLLALLLPVVANGQTLFTCKNEDGSSAYQQRPCSENQRPVGNSYVPRVPDAGASWAQQESARQQQRDARRPRLPETSAASNAAPGSDGASAAQAPSTATSASDAKPAGEPIITSINGKPVERLPYRFVDQNGNRYFTKPTVGLDSALLHDHKGVLRKCAELANGTLHCREY